MGKKLLVGCLVIVVIGGVLLAVGGYFLYRAAAPVIQDARNYLQGLAELGDLEQDIVNRNPFVAPENGELDGAQVERFVRVQDGVRLAMGERMAEIEAKYKHLKANTGSNQPPSFSEVTAALRDIGRLFVDARRYQVDALNKERFSQEEYNWVRARVFQAAGVEVANMVDLKKLEEALRRNTGVDDLKAPELPKMDVPEKNRELVKPYLGRMDGWIPLAFFGL